jgi:hypothetical protein
MGWVNIRADDRVDVSPHWFRGLSWVTGMELVERITQ